jgi:DNA-binding NarL/FixJ family response regulator
MERGFLSLATVFVADDNLLVMERVSALLRPLFQLIGTADNGRDLVTEAQRLHPDVIVLDITMPILTGLEAAHKLHEAGLAAKLVFLSVHEDPELIHACFAEGAYGYVSKARLRMDLVSAIHQALAGHHFVSPSLTH